MSQLKLSQVDAIVGAHSMASVRSWLASNGTSMPSATPRAEFAKSVLNVMEKQKLSLDALNLGMIDIEEASGKRVCLYRTAVGPKEIAAMRKQVLDIVGALSAKRIPAPQNPSAPRRVYVIEEADAFRAKWAETHKVYKQDLSSLSLVPVKETKLVVLVLRKASGLVQLRYDQPGTTHPHGKGARSTAAEFFQHYKETVETLLGVQLDEVELRPALTQVVNLIPRVVECRSTEISTEDNYTVKVIPKVRGKDVRDSKDMGAMSSHGTNVKVREVEDLTWFPEQSSNAIVRKVKTRVDGRESYVRFEADYHEGEVNYVLGRLFPA